MATIVTRAGKGSALTWQEADDNFTNLNSAKLENVVEDLSPQLGANLDVNGKSIVSVSNGNINITPNGTGKVLLKGVKFGPGGSSVATNTAGGNSALDNNTTGSNNTSFGYESMVGNTNGGNNTSIGTYSLKRNANNSSNTAVGYNALTYAVGGLNTALGASSGVILDTGTNNTFLGYNAGSAIANGSYNIVIGSNTGSSINGLSNNIIVSDGQGNIRISVDSTGKVKLGSLIYPIADGTTGQYLTTDGSGNIGFTTLPSIPTKTSDLTNDSGFITSNDIPTNVSAFTNDANYVSSGANISVFVNDAGYITINDIPTSVSSFTNDALYISENDTAATIAGELSLPRLQIDTLNTTYLPTVGGITWDDGNGCLQVGLKGGAVTLQIGQEQVVRVYNGTGSTLTDGQIVYITGAQGNRLSVALASASSEEMSSVTIGMVTETILNGDEGFITTSGLVNNLNTLGLTEGSALWLSTVAGQYTTTRPTAPNHGVLVGYVVRTHETAGSIYVHIQNGYELNELHDVLITDKQNNQTIVYDSTNTVWKNSDLKTINGTSIVGTGNIVVTSGQGLGSITAYKADGSQDNIDVNANTSLTQLGITQELLLDASALVAIESTSSYGWKDNIAPFVIKGTGVNNPSWITLFSGLSGYGFSSTTMNEVWVDFHIDHDYALGTALYPHVHWVPTTTGTGVVRWGIEYSVAKGHQQGASSIFPASTTVYVEQTISTNSQWMHFVAEVSDINAIPSTNVEPDTVIKIRVFRDAAHPNDTYAGTVHAWQSDLHYRSNRFATLNKAPSFNG